MAQRPKKLLDQVRDALRLKHYSVRTENCYVAWTKRYIQFHNKQHPLGMSSAEIEAFLTLLAATFFLSLTQAAALLWARGRLSWNQPTSGAHG